MKTFEQVLQELGVHSPDEFYELMKEYWSNNTDAILTINPKNEAVEIGTIYSNDWYNVDCGKVLLLRLNLPNKEKFNQEWYSIIYEAEFNLKRSQESNYEVF